VVAEVEHIVAFVRAAIDRPRTIHVEPAGSGAVALGSNS
jgi:hypothetical protein